MLHNPTITPKFLTKGITYLLPKSERTQDPSQYRPITCLPTIYKLFSSIICTKIYQHLNTNNIITEEQKGSKEKVLGCKEQLTIDAVVLNQAKKFNRNLNMAFVDYKKAFDSIPHTWLIQVLKIYKICPTIVQLLETVMKDWKTQLQISSGGRVIKTEEIRIKRGIFQGDSLSALWFCVALNPISRTLTDTGYGFNIKAGRHNFMLSHLLYMDDLKLFTATRKQLETVLKLVHKMSEDVGMEFGIDKCRTVTVERGRLIETPAIQIQEHLIIPPIEGQPYKYLGVSQTSNIEHSRMKAKIIKEFESRLRKLLKTKLNSSNMMKAVNTYAISILSYSFGVISWTVTDLEDLNRRLRVMMTKFKMHHPRSSTERVTLPRDLGGRGYIDIKNACYTQINLIRTYFYSRQQSPIHAAIIRADTGTPLKLNNIEYSPLNSVDRNDSKIDRWAGKELHGRYWNSLQGEEIDRQASLEWLRQGNLFPETEGFVLSIQDQVIRTRNYEKHIMKERMETDKCRKCNVQAETVEHIISGCGRLAPTRYLARHNAAAMIVYLEILKICDIHHDSETPYYRYNPNPVEESERYKVYWDRTIITDVTTAHNRPDITVIDKQRLETLIIDISIPNTRNMTEKYDEKITHYSDLRNEILDMWNMRKVTIVPVILSALGVIPKSLRTSLKKIGIDYKVHTKMQKAVLLHTAGIVRSFLGSE